MSMAAAQEEEGTSEEMALLVSSLESMGMAAAQEEEEGTSEKMAALEEEGTSEEIAAQEEEVEGTCDEERTSEEFAAQEEEEGTSEEIEPDYERSGTSLSFLFLFNAHVFNGTDNLFLLLFPHRKPKAHKFKKLDLFPVAIY
ncbi:hypothetical protein MRB53_015611 [Persea americana]|uniref:Uncharacterized protein n=1 Tax=Persea americana TaxID=3435 RepID=A0ACC2LZR5_PERAE|nr:hypothetical protein MRB53_015611 [Persea americana]